MPYCSGCEMYHKDSDPCKSTLELFDDQDDKINRLEIKCNLLLEKINKLKIEMNIVLFQLSVYGLLIIFLLYRM